MIDLENKYPGQAEAGDANYPTGGFKNETTPGVFDGTPYEKAWANDVVTELLAAFEREYESGNCRDLIGIDFSASGWQERYQAAGCKEKCIAFVGFSATWVARRLVTEGLMP